MDNRRYSVGRKMARKQSSAGPPEMEMVTVAVLPPRLPIQLGDPSAVVIAGAADWDAAINVEHNQPIEQAEVGKGKQFMRKMGLTTHRERAHPDNPPFKMRVVTYEMWRKHYAKDKDGNYHGTHAPAHDCLLKPDDVAKWRLGEAKTKADLWTRGSEVLPVYDEAMEHGRLPDYEFEQQGMPPEPVVQDVNDPAFAPVEEPPAFSERDERQVGQQSTPQSVQQGDQRTKSTSSTGKEIADGKTAQQIIEEAKQKHSQKKKEGWMAKLKRGTETAMMGS